MSASEAILPEYLHTAEATVARDERIGEFILSVFPSAQPNDIQKMTSLITGYFHDGLEVGLVLSGESDLSKEASAYNQGVEDGFRLGVTEGEKLAKNDLENMMAGAFIRGMFETFKIIYEPQGEL